ncbi:hypothetical protein [Streptomyces sp. NPDC056883]|uniref:hypothetical protein n=1 Tax=Streptomyces sp. NPDC056883 TaxID=3345959 RepID=UPI0036AD3583
MSISQLTTDLPLPVPGWVFVHMPMNRCGRTNRCTVASIESDRVIWFVGDGADAMNDWYGTPLFDFAHAVARGEYFTAPDVPPAA